MNRFDASTIWNTVSDDIADADAPFADQEEPASELGSAHPDQPAFPDQPSWVDSEQDIHSSWSAAVRAQTFFVPLHYETNYRYPLVVWLHSDGFNENQVCHVMPHVSTRNYLATGIRAPKACDASGHRFDWSESDAALESAEQSVLSAIDRAANRYSVHAERIVLAGYQGGGSMAMRIALRNPELFAAVVSLGGEFKLPHPSQLDRQRLRARRLPMLWQRSIQNADYDEQLLIGEAKAAVSIRAQLEIRQYRNDDEMNTVVLSDLDRWIMNHVVSGAPVARIDKWDTSPTMFSDN